MLTPHSLELHIYKVGRDQESSFLDVGVTANQVVGFVLLWGAVFVLGYLNARSPAPEPPPTAVGAGRIG